VRRLRTIAIEGFKTFARPTVVDLADGMTMVVGPNGCGKSNLIDAIAWAVGSRSWKSLRGSEMEDVIFHGADTVQPAERAVVRLVFENSDRALALDMEDVEVSREIDRTNGSRSFINRVESRVKDLQALLAGTGLVGGFSLVRQGTVDKLILSPPEELGRWIEEAANIAGFRARKLEALDRIEKVKLHLAQSERHLDALRRELRKVRDRAAGARKKKSHEERLKYLTGAIAAAERSDLERKILRLGEKRSALAEKDQELAQRRETLLPERARLEEDLAGPANPEPEVRPAQPEAVPLLPEELLGEKVGRIRSIESFLSSLAARLEAEGPEAWPRTRAGLDRAIELIREVHRTETTAPAPTPPPVAASRPSPLTALRRISREIDEIDQERATVARAIAACDQEKARLEERLTLLGPATSIPGGASEEIDLDQARAEIERLNGELATLGPVDETAAQREADLTREIGTAKASAKDLREAQGLLVRFLEQVDVLAAQVFKSTLLKVEKRFQKYFEVLFGGGHVRLRIQPPVANEAQGAPHSDLPDESRTPPVEIYVKLPGKGESALTLLSGGEKSLTGIALVLALAAGDSEEGKGGRLLIMDEVDAALDQANALRFARLVSQLAKTHQILCVTHNHLTTQEASRLIGITSGVAAGTSIVVETELPPAPATHAVRTPGSVATPAVR